LDLSQTQDKKAFLDYLGEINSSLAKVSQSVSTTEATQQKMKSDNKAQKQKLRGGIEKIRIILNTSTDLENLKTHTQSLLDDIVQSLDSSTSIIEQSEQELIDLATKQSAELASVVDKAKSIVNSFELSPNSSVDADVDKLTQLKNQGTLAKELVRELAVHKKRQQRLCLCIGDVQSLQLINDEYGRNAGDKALELLAKEIESKSKASDFLAYADNGRFILLKPITEFAAAGTEVVSLNSELAKLPFRFKGNEVKVNLTFAIQQSSLSDTATSLIEKTELALKKAKLAVAAMPIDAAMAEPPA
jgi:diguanylate cyclase (GGDEF)-like protein